MITMQDMRRRAVASEPSAPDGSSVQPGKRVTNRRYRGWWIVTETMQPAMDWTRYVVWEGLVQHKSFATEEEAERYVDEQQAAQ